MFVFLVANHNYKCHMSVKDNKGELVINTRFQVSLMHAYLILHLNFRPLDGLPIVGLLFQGASCNKDSDSCNPCGFCIVSLYHLILFNIYIIYDYAIVR